jgi:ubiquinone biosynthesis accessory factor UbiK
MMAMTIFMSELRGALGMASSIARGSAAGVGSGEIGISRRLYAAFPDGAVPAGAGCWGPRYNPQDMPMIDLSQIDELARRLSGLVPPALREGRDEMQDNFKSALQAGLARLDLVTREEFDVQRAVLTRTREQLESLRSLVEQLEAQLAPRDDTRNTPPPQA